MSFNGSIIKTKAKEARYTIQGLAVEIGVTRQTVAGWIAGSVPRGSHLVKLCSVLGMKPDSFFSEPAEKFLTVPLHRTIGRKQVDDVMRDASKELAEQYVNLFRQAPGAALLPVARILEKTEANAIFLAESLRHLSDISDEKAMDYEGAFQLLSKVGIYTIFREFPESLKKHSYAFYSCIAGKRVVFVNIDTSPLDLIFYLLHETVHAILDETKETNDEEEEAFCDKVASLTQFPDYYANIIAESISEISSPGTIVNILKNISLENKHSLYGIYSRLKQIGRIPKNVCERSIAGAAYNLKTKFKSIRELLFTHDDPRNYVEMLYRLSPNFMELIGMQVQNCSIRKLGEWLGLDNSMDAQMVLNEITRRVQK